MHLRLLIAVALSLLSGASRAPLHAGPPDQAPLTPAEIQQAIDFGKSGTPRPYLLRPLGGSQDDRSIVALVYTPFVRVALLS